MRGIWKGPLKRLLWATAVLLLCVAMAPVVGVGAAALTAQPPEAAPGPAPAVHHGGEAALVLPDLSQAMFLGIDGRTLLTYGLVVVLGGLFFGLFIYRDLKSQPVHASMAEIGDLIYETCKTYLLQQGKFLLILETFIATIIVFYFGFMQHFEPIRVVIILLFSLVGIAGSYGVAW